MTSVRIAVTGHVQGVGFRYFVLRRAEGLGLGGWVRNAADGSVEIEASGDRAKLEQFIEAIRPGPRTGRVENVAIEWRAESAVRAVAKKAPGTADHADRPSRAIFQIL